MTKKDLKGIRFEDYNWTYGEGDDQREVTIATINLPDGETWFDARKLVDALEFANPGGRKTGNIITRLITDTKNYAHLTADGVETSAPSRGALDDLLKVEKDLS